MPHPEFLKQPTDEVLEEIWCRREKGDETLTGLIEASNEDEAKGILRRLESEGLVRLDAERIELTDQGRRRAMAVVRSHRLAERLLVDVLGVPVDEADKTACLMEHVLSPVVIEAVCSFLGHPPTCPHGESIPLGDCCAARKNGVRPLVMPLDEVEPGGSAHIVFIAPGVQKRLDRLASFGVMPGTTLVLKQKRPSFVVEIEGTTLALEKDVAREIFVRRES